MKKLTTVLTLVAATVFFAFTAPEKKADTYNVDAAKSTIAWNGKKVTGEHTGNIKFATGSIQFNGKSITGGSLIVDMNSITCTDITNPDYNAKLVGHLKADDFFGTDKFATAKIDITGSKSLGGDKYEITGNLTIKGITKPITFPATVKQVKNALVGAADVTINRTQFDIKYGSASFFNLGDKAINDDFTLKISLVAAK
ncbi:YceI family protein [Solitalea sp. MAHUQ-68]|uniref:YceI family protein n=1 Tax=Solitalea agri TaxID=2953739 RepID=A0A9X2F316_9SPHI|nr:YceI family protein [Solitalea agri]MCO4293225.1 YceI family protein [Solitalea agri]